MNLRRSKLLDAETSEPLAEVDAGLEGLALEDTGKETTGKGVTGTVGVVDLLGLDGVDGELLDTLLALDGNKGRVSALSDNGNSLSLGVLLGKVGKVLDDVLGLLAGQAVGLGVSSGLGLVTDDVVPVGGAGIDNLLEELGDEGGGEGEDKDLVVLSSLLGKLHDGGGADWFILAQLNVS